MAEASGADPMARKEKEGAVTECPLCGAEVGPGARDCPGCGRYVPRTPHDSGRAVAVYKAKRSLALILWCYAWPFSHVFGVPDEAEADVPWRRAAVLLVYALVMVALVLTGLRLAGYL